MALRSGGIDYSEWDHFGDSDSEQEQERTINDTPRDLFDATLKLFFNATNTSVLLFQKACKIAFFSSLAPDDNQYQCHHPYSW